MTQRLRNKAVRIRIGNKDNLYHPNRVIGQKPTSTFYKGRFGSSMIAVLINLLTNSEVHPPKYGNKLCAFLDQDWMNLVQLLGWIETNLLSYFVMETAFYNLSSYIKTGEIPNSERIKICHDIAKGLNFLHSNNLLHKDIKPENVLVFKEKFEFSPVRIVAKLRDFKASHEIRSASITPPEGLPSTEIWMSPEVITAFHDNTFPCQLTTSIDIFCLGMTFYFTLSGGKHPFARYGDLQISNFKDLKYLPKKLDRDPKNYTVNHLLIWMMQNLPENRPNMGQVLNHPIFWDDETRFHFIFDITCQFDPMPFKRTRDICRAMDYRYEKLYKKVYRKTFDSTQIATKCVGNVGCSDLQSLNFTKYKQHSLVSMLRFFRDEPIIDIRSSSDYIADLVKFRLSFLGHLPELIIFLFCCLTAVTKSPNGLKERYCKYYENVDVSFITSLIGDWEEP